MKTVLLTLLPLVAAVLFLVGQSARAAGDAPTDTIPSVRPSITIRTDPDSALVFLDGVRLGPSPVILDSLQPGPHILRLAHPDFTNWLTDNITDTINIASGETRVFRYTFRTRFSIVSLPSGAGVSIGDSVLGLTPLTLSPGILSEGKLLTVRKEGYGPASVSTDSARHGVVTISLAKEWEPGNSGDSPFASSSVLRRDPTRLYISGALAVAAGFSAAYFKIKADDRQDAYVATGDPSIASERSRLDTRAAISLAVTQVSLALFTYFLLSE